MLSLAMRRGLGAAAAAGTAGAAAWYNSTQLAACHEATPASEVDLSGVPQVWAENLREVLFTESQIDKRVREMAAEISKDYEAAGVKQVYAVGLLKGAFVVVPDMTRRMTVPTVVDFMAASSYGSSTESSGTVKIKKDLDFDPVGKDILIIEDLIDTGTTLKYIKAYLLSKGVKSVKIACLLSKMARRTEGVEVDYIGFDCPDEFVVGYGMDFAEEYRSLPFVGVLKPSAYMGPMDDK